MRKSAWMAAIGALAVGTPAHAQIVVFDPRAVAQAIEQVRKAQQVIENGRAQIAEAQRLYADLNKLTDIPNMVPQLGRDALRQIGRTDDLGAITAGTTGNATAIGAKARDYYEQWFGSAPTGAGATPGETAYREMLGASGKRVATDMAVADVTAQSVQQRAAGLDVLRQRLATAGTAKEIADLQARIAVEQAQMTNDEIRLRSLDMMRAAQGEAGAQVRRQANRSARGRDADYFSGR